MSLIPKFKTTPGYQKALQWLATACDWLCAAASCDWLFAAACDWLCATASDWLIAARVHVPGQAVGIY